MSFRSKVLDALDIKRDHVRIPVYQTFNNPDSTVDPVIGTSTADLAQAVQSTEQPYAVSKCLRRNIIGPKNRSERIEVLGFVVGDDPGTTIASPNPLTNGFQQALPDCVDRGSTGLHTGFHYLGGVYDSSNPRLQVMRKSAIMPLDEQTMYKPLSAAGADQTLIDHSHTDWPSKSHEQAIKLSENPMADALYYHKTQLRFLLTGIDDVGNATSGDAASNHRGTVRMLVLRNRTPAIRTRVEGSTGEFILNHGYMPNWDTELFYDKNKQLGGKLATTIEAHTSERDYNLAQSTNTALSANQQAAFLAKYNHNIDEPLATGLDSEVSVSYGLHLRETANRPLMNAPNSVHFGHFSPTPGTVHGLTPTDILMSKINKDKYAVLHDECFTLDSLHHGAASQHIANVSIPYYKKVRFAGRKVLYNADGSVKDDLANHTNDEPMNMSSRPIVLFLSYNQKISASVEGWTAISEC